MIGQNELFCNLLNDQSIWDANALYIFLKWLKLLQYFIVSLTIFLYKLPMMVLDAFKLLS